VQLPIKLTLSISVPELEEWDPDDIFIEPFTTGAELQLPANIFDSSVGSITKIALLISEIVSDSHS